MTVLAIDQGTSGTKAIVVDPQEGVVGVAEVAVHPRYLDGGGVEQDPAELLESVLGTKLEFERHGVHVLEKSEAELMIHIVERAYHRSRQPFVDELSTRHSL